MISADGIVLFIELKRADDYMASEEVLRERCADRLDGTFEEAVDNLKSLGLVEQLHIAPATDSYKLPNKAMSSYKATTDASITYIRLNIAKAIDSCRMEAPPDPRKVLRAVHRAIVGKNFNSNYRQVVAGKRARRDPIVEFGKKLNPQDRAEYWHMIGALDDDEQKGFRSRLARLASGGS